MAMHALKLAGLSEIKACIVVPMATGMSLVLSMLAVRARCANRAAQYAVWIRIDQATCFKSMRTAGLTPIVVENVIENDQLVTDLEALKRIINEKGAENIACCISTTRFVCAVCLSV